MTSQIFKSFYSGFSLENEEKLFDEYIVKNDFTVSGFSYGAQKAFEYVLNSNKRIDTLQLFSPAFFRTKDKKYKRMQLMFFKKDTQAYCNNFLENCVKPSSINLEKYFKMGTYKELEELLYYEWDEEKLLEVKNRGVNIEVYLGCDDEIIDSTSAKDFFVKYATVYYIKDAGHILNYNK